MNCRRVEHLLSDHLEGILSEREAAAVAVHLDGCPACRQRQSEFRALGGDLRELAALLPPPHLARRAIERWAAEGDGSRRASARTPPRASFLSPALAYSAFFVAAAVALAAFGVVRWEHSHASRQETPLIASKGNTGAVAPKQSRAPSPRLESPASQFVNLADPKSPIDRPAPELRPGDQQVRQAFNLPPIAPLPPRRGAPSRPQDDLAWLNDDPVKEAQRWTSMPRDEWAALEAEVKRNVRVKDDFVQIPFPRIAGTGDRPVVAAVEAYKREAAVIDARLVREVTCAFKAAALSDLCDHLRADTGIQLSAGPSVADEKVTIFCEKLPLREVMRQLSRTFGYTWLRSKREGGDYRYELVQDLKSQLLEEEMRNGDRNAALVALDRDMDRYRPYLSLSPDEALARSKSAGEGDKKLLETLSGAGWGPIHMYSRLSPQDQAALLSGQELKYRAKPETGERPLPEDIARGVLQSQRGVRLVRDSGDKGAGSGPPGEASYGFAHKDDPSSLPPSAVPDARAGVTLKLDQTELGRFGMSGSSEVHLGGGMTGNDNGPYAIGLSPSVTQPDNAVLNAKRATDPALKGRVTVTPGVSRQSSVVREVAQTPSPTPHDLRLTTDASKLTSADVLEALHRASGMPIVADFYTRLYPADSVMVKDQPLFAALNRLADAMRLRWSKEGGSGEASEWLQFRSASFYNDRLKEVPNRLLARWSAARKEHGTLRMDDLIEIAALSDAQLDAASMADGARELWGLEEWDLACNRALRPHLHWFAALTLAQRQAIRKPPGLRFTTLSLSQQQQFISLAVGDAADAVSSLAELASATVQVDYSLPGAFEWQAPEKHGGPPEPLAPVRAPAREAAFAAARRIDPAADLSQIQPTRLALTLLYQWGAAQDHGSFRIHTTGRGDTSIDRNRSKNSP